MVHQGWKLVGKSHFRTSRAHGTRADQIRRSMAELDQETLDFLAKLEQFFGHSDFTDALREFFSKHVPSIEFKSYDDEQPLK